jgi:hypothetical protein
MVWSDYGVMYSNGERGRGPGVKERKSTLVLKGLFFEGSDENENSGCR